MALLACVAVPAALAQTGTFTAFGPQRYECASGAPLVITDSFSVRNPGAEYVLRVWNANVASAVISLNGARIIGPESFNQTVTPISRPVTLAQSNQLAVEVHSGPGTFITVEIVGKDAELPVLAVTSPPDGTTVPTDIRGAHSLRFSELTFFGRECAHNKFLVLRPSSLDIEPRIPYERRK